MDETLYFAKQNPQSLLNSVEVKDPHGQRIFGTPLQILLIAGERTNHTFWRSYIGMVERLMECFTAIPDEFNKQYQEWNDNCESATLVNIAPYIKALEDLCDRIINSNEINDDSSLSELLNSSTAVNFQKAVIPNPDHIIKAGICWDIQIFFAFIKLFTTKMNNLPETQALKSALFTLIALPALQSRMCRGDMFMLEGCKSKCKAKNFKAV